MEIIRRNGVATSFHVPLVSVAARPDYKDNPTLAAGDVKVVRYASAAWSVANIDTLPTAITGATRVLHCTMTATELTSDDNTRPITLLFIDQTNPKEWDDQMVTIHLSVTDSVADKLDTMIEVV